MKRPIEDFCCQSIQCSDQGKRGAGNLRQHGWSSKKKRVSVVPGKRTAENTHRLVQDFKQRTEGRPMELITSDEYAPYKKAILEAYGTEVLLPRTGKPGRPTKPYKIAPLNLKYAHLHKIRKNGQVVKVSLKVIFGTVAVVMLALAKSAVSKVIDTSFIERHNGTDRNRNARKIRRTYCFSKDWDVHAAMTYFTMYSYNFCWPVRTLCVKDREGNRQKRTPAMAAGLADHVWTMKEWGTYPALSAKLA